MGPNSSAPFAQRWRSVAVVGPLKEAREHEVPIPELTPHGVLPSGRHSCTLSEIQARYTGNAHRSSLWSAFCRFLKWTNNQPKPSAIIIDGGFTSDKDKPKDIDFVFDLTGRDQICQNHWAFVFLKKRKFLMDSFMVDFWVYFPGAPNDLRSFFEYVKLEEAISRGMQPGDRKGVLVVTP